MSTHLAFHQGEIVIRHRALHHEIEDEGPGILCEVENVEWMVEDRISMRTLCSVGIGFRPILLWYKRLMLVVEGL